LKRGMRRGRAGGQTVRQDDFGSTLQTGVRLQTREQSRLVTTAHGKSRPVHNTTEAPAGQEKGVRHGGKMPSAVSYVEMRGGRVECGAGDQRVEMETSSGEVCVWGVGCGHHYGN